MQSTLLNRCIKPFAAVQTPRRNVRRNAINPAALQEMMKNPEMAAKLKAAQEAMQRPEMQQQLAQMQAVMGNPTLQARMQELRNDPEFADFWKDVQTGGMAAMMKYYNDPAFLAKLSSKVADAIPKDAAAAAAAAAAGGGAGAGAAYAPPEVKDLLGAARYGDLEAVEDFIAIGKDVNMKDPEGRTPLHYAAGYNHAEIASMLITEGASLEACDSKGNTPLHYASGYGRPALVKLLLDAGAKKDVKNANGSTPYQLGTGDARNPVSQDAELVARLKV